MVEQRAVLYTAAGLGRGRVGATIETMPGLDRPNVSVMIRNGTGAETERFVTRALQSYTATYFIHHRYSLYSYNNYKALILYTPRCSSDNNIIRCILVCDRLDLVQLEPLYGSG
jgi:hypothetical protein